MTSTWPTIQLWVSWHTNQHSTQKQKWQWEGGEPINWFSARWAGPLSFYSFLVVLSGPGVSANAIRLLICHCLVCRLSPQLNLSWFTNEIIRHGGHFGNENSVIREIIFPAFVLFWLCLCAHARASFFVANRTNGHRTLNAIFAACLLPGLLVWVWFAKGRMICRWMWAAGRAQWRWGIRVRSINKFRFNKLVIMALAAQKVLIMLHKPWRY